VLGEPGRGKKLKEEGHPGPASRGTNDHDVEGRHQRIEVGVPSDDRRSSDYLGILGYICAGKNNFAFFDPLLGLERTRKRLQAGLPIAASASERLQRH
jgi:hypothetical protein